MQASESPQPAQWFSLELVLGIIGTITGIAGLIIHFIRMRRERPVLSLDLLKCQHRVTKNRASSIPTPVGTLMELEARVNNKGDWDTTINDVQLSYSDYRSTREKLAAGGVKITKHETQMVQHSFFIYGKAIAEPTLDCRLTV